jgi:hypothetical protein
MPTSSITTNKIFGVLGALAVDPPSPHPLSCETAKIALANQKMTLIILASGFF